MADEQKTDPKEAARDAALALLVGRVMRETNGRYHPEQVRRIVRATVAALERENAARVSISLAEEAGDHNG